MERIFWHQVAALKCEECGGNKITIILWSMQNRMNNTVTWLPWLSIMRRRVTPLAFARVNGSKTILIQSSPIASQVHLLVLKAQLQSLSISDGIYNVWMDCPLKITNGLIALPSLQTHSSMVTHSVHPGSAWYAFFSAALQTTYAFCLCFTDIEA